MFLMQQVGKILQKVLYWKTIQKEFQKDLEKIIYSNISIINKKNKLMKKLERLKKLL